MLNDAIHLTIEIVEDVAKNNNIINNSPYKSQLKKEIAMEYLNKFY